MGKFWLFAFVKSDGSGVPLFVANSRELRCKNVHDYHEDLGELLTEPQYLEVVEHLRDNAHPHEFLIDLLGTGQHLEGELVGYSVEGNTFLTLEVTEHHRWKIECSELDDSDTFLSHTWTAEVISTNP
jgi:hypothetical protein